MQATELRQMRRQLELTQAELADMMGLSGAYIGELERGEKAIDAKLEQRLHAIVWPRIDISYSDALSGWTVTITSPGPKGRQHVVAAKFDDLDEATRRARTIEQRFYPGARIVVYDRQPADRPETTNPSGL